jgi:predicted AlkP superfamily phosphohydrolase/phosphomutase
MLESDRKVVVLGLDGVPYSLLAEYLNRGLMPALARCCEQGQLLRMRSSLPEVSSVSWSNFMTGMNPGQHGIFGFVELNAETYEYSFPNFSALKVAPFWERENLRTVAFNIPQTYPARPMNGVMVSGFVALDLKKATFPDRVYRYLKSIDYHIDVNAKLATENPEKFFVNLFETLAKRKLAIEYLYDSEDWQLFIATVTETDRLHHFFFKSALDGQYYPIFKRFYLELDNLIDSLSQRAARDGALFLTCSDHGFTPIRTEVYINTWLVENNYLQLEGQKGLASMTSSSEVFCLDPSRLYLHLRERYARGKVERDRYEDLLAKLKEQLTELTFEGDPVIHRIFSNQEIFQGDFSTRGPDLYLLPHYGYDLKGALGRPRVFATSHFQGMHTYDDAHLFISQQIAVDNIAIEDVSKIILQYFSR